MSTTCGSGGAGRRLNVMLNGATQASFSYDGRTSKTIGSGQTTTHINDASALAQYDSTIMGPAAWSWVAGDAQNNRSLTDERASANPAQVKRRTETGGS